MDTGRLMPGVLVILGGLPGSGKTTIARALARRTGATHLRIDTIEQALREANPAFNVEGEGYVVAYRLAEDNLRLGQTVIADSVNPEPLTREAWLDAAHRAGAAAFEVEIICSAEDEHRRRVEKRESDITGLVQPDWAAVLARDYRPWASARLVIDTAVASADEAAGKIAALIGA